MGLTLITLFLINADSRFESRGLVVTDFQPTQPLSLGRHPHAIVPAFYTAAASARRKRRRTEPTAAAHRCQTDQDGGDGDTRLMFAQRRTPPGRETAHPAARPRPAGARHAHPTRGSDHGVAQLFAGRSSFAGRSIERTKETRPIEMVIERIHLRSVRRWCHEKNSQELTYACT